MHLRTTLHRLARSRLVSLDVGALLGGTQYRGAFEERLTKLLQEVRAAKGGVLLFVDEVHMLGTCAI